MAGEEKQVLYQLGDALAFGRDTLERIDILLGGTLFEQGDFALALNGGERVVQFVRSIADERFFRLESGVDSVQHSVQRADEVVQFILVAECFHPYVQVVSTDALQLFEDVF